VSITLHRTAYTSGGEGKTVDAAIEEAFAKLKLLEVFEFHKTRVLAPEQRGWVQFVCDRYLNGLPYERKSIHSLVTPEISFIFFMYAGAMAVEAVRERDEGKVFKGLVALSVENQVFDWRDSMMVLVRLHHSAVKIGADAPRLFHRAAAISSLRTGDGFLEFAARTSKNVDLAEFGYQEGTDSEGNFAYISK
jgi:hypothetical protein